jgi:hypothetical protein
VSHFLLVWRLPNWRLGLPSPVLTGMSSQETVSVGVTSHEALSKAVKAEGNESAMVMAPQNVDD